jgi:hypothetical protein
MLPGYYRKWHKFAGAPHMIPAKCFALRTAKGVFHFWGEEEIIGSKETVRS